MSTPVIMPTEPQPVNKSSARSRSIKRQPAFQSWVAPFPVPILGGPFSCLLGGPFSWCFPAGATDGRRNNRLIR